METVDPANLRALREQDVSPRIIIQTLQQEIDNIALIHVVTFDEDGQAKVYTSGNLPELSLAAHVLSDAVYANLNL
jgi:hypothetical protein